MTQRISAEHVEEVAEFFRREQDALVRYATWLTGDPEVAKDLAQLAFMEAARQWETVRDLGVSSRRRWIRRVSSNKWFDELRRRTRFRSLYDALAVPELDQRPGPPVQAEARTALEAALRAMEDLPQGRRVIAQLYWLADYSTAEIAEVLGVASSGVRKQLAIAAQTIRSAVHEYVDVPMAAECLYPVAEAAVTKPVTAEEGG